MPLQNRVTPFSSIEAVPDRGMFTGNRGCLHDDHRNLATQRWRSARWIVCVLDYKGWRRELMRPRRWTELFFLDEAVAFSAGHRPCAFCRYQAYRAFIDRWSQASGKPARADLLDAALQRERVARIQGTTHWHLTLGELPDGAFVRRPEMSGTAWLKLNGRVLEWSHAGYVRAERWPDTDVAEILTPPSTLTVLRAGYRPVLHPSAETLLVEK
ncbi:MAG TPA: hypothetical protein VGP82_10680 [Ktedonobacterales bacterium]|nr:hypothetical protein [Ktedonobacterales bacterium]